MLGTLIFANVLIVIVLVILERSWRVELCLVSGSWGSSLIIAVPKVCHLLHRLLCLLLNIPRIWNRKQQQNCLNHGPTVVAERENDACHKEGAESEVRVYVAKSAALVAGWIQVDATFADVAWNFTVALRNFIEAILLTLFNLQLLDFTLILFSSKARFLKDARPTGSSFSEVSNIALKIHLGASAGLDF